MIGKTIKAILTGDTTLTALVSSTSMFPYVMNENTDLPALIYAIDSVEPYYTKKEWVFDMIEFSVLSFSRDYGDLQDIVSAIRSALEVSEAGAGTEDINRIIVTGMEEGFDLSGDVFFNRLKFKVKVNTY